MFISMLQEIQMDTHKLTNEWLGNIINRICRNPIQDMNLGSMWDIHRKRINNNLKYLKYKCQQVKNHQCRKLLQQNKWREVRTWQQYDKRKFWKFQKVTKTNKILQNIIGQWASMKRWSIWTMDLKEVEDYHAECIANVFKVIKKPWGVHSQIMNLQSYPYTYQQITMSYPTPILSMAPSLTQGLENITRERVEWSKNQRTKFSAEKRCL